MAYASISIEGSLFPSDLLERIASGDISISGQKPADFGINSGRRLIDEMQSAFSDARSYWDAFQRRLERSRESQTTITREYWVAEFLELLGFDKLVIQRASAEVGGDKYFISHRFGEDPDAPPVHIVGVDQELDRRDGTGRRSPHALVQEYLNRSDALWGLVTNGRRMRLLRDTARVSKPTYLEFDLEGMIGGNLYSEFVVLYRLLHSSRFPKEGLSPHECLLERYYQQGIDEGGRVREKLSIGVAKSLRVLGTAFLAHPKSEALRQKFQSGQLNSAMYYRQLLRLVYRFLFLMVAEERRLIFPSEGVDIQRQAIYSRYYGMARLRERADRYFIGDENTDLWLGLRKTFHMLQDNYAAKLLGLSALNGELFSRLACADLEDAVCTNQELLKAIREVSTFRDDGGPRRRVNYAGLDVEEFGSVYESLLDFHPHVTLEPPSFDLLAGGERKQTGSYYTPPELVRELINSALVPVIEDRLKGLKTREEREAALLDLRVLDPASGSGHFLLSAARCIARELAKVRSGEQEPSPEEYRHALRDIIRNCIYAVDKNPLAVDLCKVALWIEGHSAGLPLSFLDHHVKCGDSLVGVFDLSVLEQGIPDDAYKPVTGDDKQAARYYRDRNRQEKMQQRQLSLGEQVDLAGIPDTLAEEFQALGVLEELTPDDVNAKEMLYDSLRRQGTDWWRLKVACDLWTSAFFMPIQPGDGFHLERLPTTGTLTRHLKTNSAYPALVGQAVELSVKHPFFHWPLEFADVFEQGGFDVVLGNPPWERIKLHEKEFFAVRDPEIARATNKAARERLIRDLPLRNPALADEFEEAKHCSEAQSKFVRTSDRFPLTGRGDINTYSIFTETARAVVHSRGRVGMIVPSGIATDDTTKEFFADLVQKHALVSLFDFENREGLFPDSHRSYKFCLLTLTGPQTPHRAVEFGFFLHRTDQLHDPGRRFTLSAEDFRLMNPNTLTCPISRSQRDAEIAKDIYRRVPVLMNENTEENPWGITFLRMFDMTNDSHLFQMNPATGMLPVYEAKMIEDYDHRLAGVAHHYDRVRTGEPVETTLEEHMDPSFRPKFRYWVDSNEVVSALEGREANSLLVYKDITTASSEKTFKATILPFSAVGNSAPIIVIEPLLGMQLCLLGNFNSFILDYVARQKIGYLHINFFVLKQFPVLTPDIYENPCLWLLAKRLEDWIVPRVSELLYTAWDLQEMAHDVGYDGPPFRWDPERRFLLRCELDAAFFHLYGIDRDDMDYIMDTFPIVKRKDEQQYGEYRTKRVILEIYDDMAKAMHTGEPYRTRLDPPPADPCVAHPATREAT